MTWPKLATFTPFCSIIQWWIQTTMGIRAHTAWSARACRDEPRLRPYMRELVKSVQRTKKKASP